MVTIYSTAVAYVSNQFPLVVTHFRPNAFIDYTMVNNRGSTRQRLNNVGSKGQHVNNTGSITTGVIIQRRPSVIQKVPQYNTRSVAQEYDELEETDTPQAEELNFDETTPRRSRRKPKTNEVQKRNSHDNEWKPLENKRHKCTNCSMKFKKPSALVIHMRTHSGERPYKCKQCSKSFSISGNLRRHVFTHTGEKPYKCQACGRAFNNPSHLARHSKKIHI